MEDISKIQIEFLDIYPSLNELIELYSLILLFLPSNEKFDLEDLISNKKEIEITESKVSFIQVIKNDTPSTPIPFNPQNGTQWLTFNYDSKKKHSFVSILIDNCIKIKIKCNIPQSKQNNNKINFQMAKKYIKLQLNEYKTPFKKIIKIQKGTMSTKQNQNHSFDEEVNNFYLNEAIESNTKGKLTSRNFENRNKKYKSPGIHYQTPTNNSTTRNKALFNSNKSFQLSFQKEKMRNALISNIKETSINFEGNKKGREKNDICMTDSSNKNPFKKSQEKKKIGTIEREKIKPKGNSNKSKSPNKTKIAIINKDNSSHKKNPLKDSNNREVKSNIINKEEVEVSPFLNQEDNNDKSDNSNSDNHNNYKIQSMNQEKENEENFEEKELYEHFAQLKIDFDLLYTKEYIQNIPNDLLKIELELLFEKIFELILSYHSQLIIFKDKYREINKLYQRNSKKFLLINKRLLELQNQKEFFQIKEQNLNFAQGKFTKGNLNTLNINKQEIKFLDFLAKPKNNDKEVLKEILISILRNNKNVSLSLDSKHKQWYENNKRKITIMNVTKTKGFNEIKDDKEKQPSGSRLIKENEKKKNIITKKNLNNNNIYSNKNHSNKIQYNINNKLTNI